MGTRCYPNLEFEHFTGSSIISWVAMRCHCDLTPPGPCVVATVAHPSIMYISLIFV